ncbi:hypothetical protein WJX81_006265 [Elliptochloris bilobata]|uniref:2-phosphoglycerate kinase n=1 Tax=Elliptochloris bilobata TaxID=381761 RepID=A0AAW1RCV7_9CHLO
MELQEALRRLEQQAKSRHSASKYDFVKVKVWLGDNQDHYYVLSRFLISRMLTVTKVPMNKAIKVSLEVKKYLVDNEHLDISQDHLEAILFGVMRSRGYDDTYVQRYKMVTSFFQQRRPLIIMICGVPCTGKSTLAQQLASRLNLPNVLQTDIIYELLRSAEDSPLAAAPLWERQGLAPGALVGEFQRECRVVRKGVDGDLHKCIRDGKSIIMEGLHLDPGLYLHEFGRYGQAHLLERGAPSSSGDTEQRSGNGAHVLNEADVLRAAARPPSRRSASFMLAPSGSRLAPILAKPGDHVREDEEEGLGPGPVFVPIVLCMNEADHALLVREWYERQQEVPSPAAAAASLAAVSAAVSERLPADGSPGHIAAEAARHGTPPVDPAEALARLHTLQAHLCGYAARAVPVVRTGLAGFGDTLDRLHDYLLTCIQVALEEEGGRRDERG